MPGTRRGREKLLPLLLEWDMRTAAAAEGGGESVWAGRVKGEGQTVGGGSSVEFTVAAITKVAGNKGVGAPWQGAC